VDARFERVEDLSRPAAGETDIRLVIASVLFSPPDWIPEFIKTLKGRLLNHV
jgi:hypothetical protein